MTTVLAWFDGHWAAAWVWSWMHPALMYGTLLAGLTYLATRLLGRRVPASVHVTLWCLVLVKFLAPVGPSWSHSLASVWARVAAAPSLQAPGGDFVEPASMPARFPRTSPQDVEPPPWPSDQRARGWKVALTAAYLATVLGLSAMRAWRYLAFGARCRVLPPADRLTCALVAQTCRRLGVRRIPTTRISDGPPAPFVMGVFRPLLVLSRRHLVRPDELETVIMHEIAHLRRGDILVRQLQRIAGTFLFFWPVVIWVNRRIDEARECACDDWALSHGKLTAGQYARCLLSATQPAPTGRFVCHPACMASHRSQLERRIDVILESPYHLSKRSARGLPTFLLLLAWGSFTLSGAADAAQNQAWLSTEEGVKGRAIQLYNLVAEHEAADLNGNGELSYLEKDTFLVGLAMQAPEAFMAEFPYADRNHSGNLDILEANDVIRGITLIAYADRRPGAPDAGLDFQFCHMALEAQEWLLINMRCAPDARELDNIWSVLKRVKGRPDSFGVRMFDHGGPERLGKNKPCGVSARSRFQELEGSIADLQAKLAVEQDPQELAKLRVMLSKLEAIMAALQEK